MEQMPGNALVWQASYGLLKCASAFLSTAYPLLCLYKGGLRGCGPNTCSCEAALRVPAALRYPLFGHTGQCCLASKCVMATIY